MSDRYRYQRVKNIAGVHHQIYDTLNRETVYSVTEYHYNQDKVVKETKERVERMNANG